MIDRVHGTAAQAQLVPAPGAAVVALAVAVALLAAVALVPVLRPARVPAPGPHVLEAPPGVAPAVAALLLQPAAPPTTAAAAVVVDLAARGALGVVELGGGQTGLRPTGRDPGPLAPYERRVLDRVLSLVGADGLVPAGALAAATSGEAAARWRAALAAEVVAEARGAGLLRRRYGREVLVVGAVGVLAVLAVLGLLAGTASTVPAGTPVPPAGERAQVLVLVAAAVTGVAALWLWALRSAGWVALSARGQQESARVGGLAAALQDDPAFADLPPGAVAVWGRLLAYATAFGSARAVAAALPLGPEDPHRAWSDAGGHWRLVRVDQLRGPGGSWGGTPGRLVVTGGKVLLPVGLVVAALVSNRRQLALEVDVVAPALHRATWLWLLLLLPLLAVLRSAVVLLVGLASALLPGREVEGVVLRVHHAVAEDVHPAGSWVALDDGTATRVVMHLVPAGLDPQRGDRLRLRVRAVTGSARRAQVVARAAAAAPGPGDRVRAAAR